jgi:LysR family transcriptional regulator, glycine cleavage system transcriptional activator
VHALKRGELPSIDGLAAFVAAAEHGSFTRAANQLNLSQGAISRQVRELEIRLNVRLFERIRQRIVLTDAGRLYLSQVKKALDNLAEAARSVALLSNSTILNLVALPTFAGNWLVPRLTSFQKQNPAITIHITTRQLPIDYATEPFDAAVFHGAPHWPGTIAYHLMDEDLVAVASPKLGIRRTIKTADDLAKYSLLHSMGNRTRWSQWMNTAGFELREPLHGHTYQNYTMVAQAAAAGLGVGLLPRYLVEDDVARKRLEIVASEFPTLITSYYLILPETRASSVAIQAFAKWLIAEAQAFQVSNGRVLEHGHSRRRSSDKPEMPVESPNLAPGRASAEA